MYTCITFVKYVYIYMYSESCGEAEVRYVVLVSKGPDRARNDGLGTRKKSKSACTGVGSLNATAEVRWAACCK